ncbi:hypothetical protein GC098_27585 [Paenibacillus sp. LMG 31458]|uniref:Aminoglycoside phosphotransferase domain-containing protein n=1 Tax=Paenibacillus phytorum TaxID=2654977 RepID=A0ABX1Y2K0_9BACL|nr:hypothetical protein [Paenibacillus phytorum]NOU75103.1 hypothetical protein [Paenibacillus phytorum]
MGSRRIVYDLSNSKVLKVVKTTYGIKSNIREVRTFNSCPFPVRKHLAKIIDYENKYGWLIMGKYNRNFPKSKEYKRKLYEMRTLFKENGIIPYEIVNRQGEPNFQNLRLDQNGEIVVIDYGNFRFLRKK